MKKGECYGGLYRALRPLGQGGQGSVFLAVHERSSRLMALKEIPLRGQTWDSLEKSHFCHLDHDGLPKIYDLFLENGNGYVVMEYVPGWNLREYRERKGPMPGSMLLDLSGELAEILVYLHGRTPPLIHGDIKPGNLIVRKDGKLVLVDFGAAFQKDGRRQKAYATQGFSAPELFLRDGRVDISSDLYSFGKTFQYLGGGKGGGLGLRRVFAKCTAANPRRRYRSARRLLRAIRFYEKRMYLYSLLLCLCASLFFGTGTLRQRIAVVQESEKDYQEAILSNNISEIKSAVQKAPGREEGYQQLLKCYLADEAFSAEEAIALEAQLAEGEAFLSEQKEEYSGLCYDIGVAYWYYYTGSGGKTYSLVWFQKAARGTLDRGRQERSALYLRLGSFYEQKSRKERTGEGTVSYWEFWETLEAMTDAMEGSGKLEEQWAEELVGRIYENGEAFREAGVEREQMRDLLKRGGLKLSGEKEKTWEQAAQWLDQMYERQDYR